METPDPRVTPELKRLHREWVRAHGKLATASRRARSAELAWEEAVEAERVAHFRMAQEQFAIGIRKTEPSSEWRSIVGLRPCRFPEL